MQRPINSPNWMSSRRRQRQTNASRIPARSVIGVPERAPVMKAGARPWAAGEMQFYLINWLIWPYEIPVGSFRDNLAFHITCKTCRRWQHRYEGWSECGANETPLRLVFTTTFSAATCVIYYMTNRFWCESGYYAPRWLLRFSFNICLRVKLDNMYSLKVCEFEERINNF